MKLLFRIVILFALIAFSTQKSFATLTYSGRPFISWNSSGNGGTLYCYGSMMFSCCSVSGSLMFIYEYNIFATCMYSSEETITSDQVAESYHQFIIEE